MTTKSTRLIALLTAYFVVCMNWPFYSKIYGYLYQLDQIHPLFMLAIPLLIAAVLYIFFSLLVVRGLTRIVLPPLILLSAICSYAALQYGTLIDHEMIRNFIETDTAEAGTYLSWSSVSYIAVFGLLPATALLRTRIDYQPLVPELLGRLLRVTVALGVSAFVTFAFYQDFAATGRNNRGLQRYIVPTQLTYSLGKFVSRNYFQQGLPFQPLGEDAYLSKLPARPELFVLVVGETARAQNFHYAGYPRQTNPYTEKRRFIYLGDFESCGTATAVSVPCMFSFLDHQHFDHNRASHQSNVLDVLKTAGLDVEWIDNNSGCKGVCAQATYKKIATDRENPLCDGEFCLDAVLLAELQAVLDKPLTQNTLLVFHLIGSHGPTYHLRYPREHRYFQPDCARSDIQNCSREEIVNSYDNSLRYTDFVLSQMTEMLAAQPHLETALLYMSDHGESLGENGLYLHGMPWSLAPAEQKTVPTLLWLSDAYHFDHQLDTSCLAAIRQKAGLSQDNLADTLLGLIGVESGVYVESRDISAPCRTHSLAASPKFTSNPEHS